MSKTSKRFTITPFISKYFVLFFIFLFLLLFSNNSNVSRRLYLKKSNPVIYDNIKAVPTQTPFNWTVEKVDEQLTRINLPPDPRMATLEELNIAMNDYRKAHNLQNLTKNDLLCNIAQKRAEEQLANKGLDGHAGFEKYANDQSEFYRLGEVLFGGSQPQYGVHIIEYGWDRSLTGHKEAIQDPEWNHGCAGVAGFFAAYIFGTR